MIKQVRIFEFSDIVELQDAVNTYIAKYTGEPGREVIDVKYQTTFMKGMFPDEWSYSAMILIGSAD